MSVHGYFLRYKRRGVPKPQDSYTMRVGEPWVSLIMQDQHNAPVFLGCFLLLILPSKEKPSRADPKPKTDLAEQGLRYSARTRTQYPKRIYIISSSLRRSSDWNRLSASPTCLRSETSRVRSLERNACTFMGVSPREGTGVGSGSM